MSNYETRTYKLGKLTFRINEEKMRLSVTIGKNLTYIGGNNHDGRFGSMEKAQTYIEENRNELEKVKTMHSMIWKYMANNK